MEKAVNEVPNFIQGRFKGKKPLQEDNAYNDMPMSK